MNAPWVDGCPMLWCVGAGDRGATPHTCHEKPERRGHEWEMPVFRNASLPVKREVLAVKAENGPRNKQLLCRWIPENGCWGNHLCKS